MADWSKPFTSAYHFARVSRETGYEVGSVESIGGRWYAFGPDGEMQYGVASDASGALKV